MFSLSSRFALSSTPLLLSTSLQCSEWSLLRERGEEVLEEREEEEEELWWGAGGKHRNKAEYERKYTCRLRQCWDLLLPPRCLPCLMLRAINKADSELRLGLSHISNANHINNPPTFSIFNNKRTRGPLPAHLVTSIQKPILHKL